MLRARFPKVKIVQGAAANQAFAECDFLLHGSGPSLVAAKSVAQWAKETGKPYGIYGITWSAAEDRELLSRRSSSSSATPSRSKSRRGPA